MDEVDKAQEREQEIRDHALSQREPVLLVIEMCYNCKTPLPRPLRFCDAECRDDWEYRKHRQRSLYV